MTRLTKSEARMFDRAAAERGYTRSEMLRFAIGAGIALHRETRNAPDVG